jgi:GAF domain-containing protein
MQGYLPVLALAEHYVDGTPLEGWIVDGWQSNPLLPDTKAEVAIPIAAGENVLGVLDVQDDEFGGLDEADIDLLQSIANQVASALQNAQAYQQTQQQVAREALIANINQQIQSTTDVEEALQVAVRELGRALGTDTHIQLAKNSNGDQKTIETNFTEE